MSAWFRYEKDFACRWCPVVYHGEKPAEKDTATSAVPVPDSCLATDGSPLFGRLRAMFPAPPDEVAR